MDGCWAADSALNLRRQEETRPVRRDEEQRRSPVATVSGLTVLKTPTVGRRFVENMSQSALIERSVQSASGPRIVSLWRLHSSPVCSV